MRRSLYAAAAALVLAGCTGEDVPDNKLASEVVRPHAESGIAGIEVTDYRRNNGWQDTQTPGRYIVEYAYNNELKRPLAEVTLALAKDHFEAQVKENWMVEFEAKQWVKAQEGFDERTRRFLADCDECYAYWSKADSTEEGDARWWAFVLAWSSVERLGFKDADAVGAKVPSTAWATFHKTEKGWAPLK